MNNNLSIYFIKHENISNEIIEEIIKLKQQHWRYSFGQQLKWIKNNITADDFHLFIRDKDSKICAYMNMVNRMIYNGKASNNIIGIGNVCVDKSLLNKGFGLLLMDTCKFYLNTNNHDAVLLCKEELVTFYNKAGWVKFNNQRYIENSLFDNFMLFNNEKYSNECCVKIDRLF